MLPRRRDGAVHMLALVGSASVTRSRWLAVRPSGGGLWAAIPNHRMFINGQRHAGGFSPSRILRLGHTVPLCMVSDKTGHPKCVALGVLFHFPF